MKLSSQKKSIKNAKNATRIVQPYSTCIKNPFFHGTTRLDSSEYDFFNQRIFRPLIVVEKISHTYIYNFFSNKTLLLYIYYLLIAEQVSMNAFTYLFLGQFSSISKLLPKKVDSLKLQSCWTLENFSCRAFFFFTVRLCSDL